ncbi:hypothetical protein VTN96DRAFT_9380 [Rasamsonia emersonii]
MNSHLASAALSLTDPAGQRRRIAPARWATDEAADGVLAIGRFGTTANLSDATFRSVPFGRFLHPLPHTRIVDD